MIHDNVEFDFYFIRHGESESNVTLGIAAGANFDAPMTPRGHRQAEAAGKRLADEGVTFDKIYSSSLVRAVQTTVNFDGYYTGFGEDVLVVFDPSLGFTTGGGQFFWPAPTSWTPEKISILPKTG